VATLAGFNACLLVAAEDKILGTEWLTVPLSRIEIQNRPGLFAKRGVPREQPVLVMPGFDSILVQNAPNGRAAHGPFENFINSASKASEGLPTEGLLRFRDGFARDARNDGAIQRGEKLPFGHVLLDRRWSTRRWPTDFANAGPDEWTGRRFPSNIRLFAIVPAFGK
jgi:hypothetical protein